MNDRDAIRFAVILAESFRDVLAGRVPDWLQEELPKVELKRIAREAELPESALPEMLATALALHKALQIDSAAAKPNKAKPKKARLEIKSLKLELSKILQMLDDLSELSRDAIRPPPKKIVDHPDGTEVFEVGPDPVEELRQVLDAFIKHLDRAEISQGRAGRPQSPSALAALALHSLLADHHKVVSAAQCSKFAEAIWDPVRRHHGHQSKADLSDPGDVPSPKDLVRRAIKPSKTRK
jgi:hypothetical protein